MADAPLYDLTSVLTAAHIQNLVFIGREGTELLPKLIDETSTVDVVMFPYLIDEEGTAVAAAGPRRATFSGKLISVLLNERQTKGRFVFSDGTIIYRDSAILE